VKDKRTDLIINLLRIGAFLQRDGNAILHNFKISQQQFVVLNHIFRNQPVNQNNICSSLLFEKSNISKIVAKLESLKYITLKRDLSDKRNAVILCTKTGEKVIAAGLQKMNELNIKLLKRFDDDEIHRMNIHVKKISDSCRE
jgi:DNA-binding MarR family transcriptional regulator